MGQIPEHRQGLLLQHQDWRVEGRRQPTSGGFAPELDINDLQELWQDILLQQQNRPVSVREASHVAARGGVLATPCKSPALRGGWTDGQRWLMGYSKPLYY